MGKATKWLGKYYCSKWAYLTNDIVRLGGALTGATTVSALIATNKMSFTGTGVDVFNVGTTTLSVDALNNRVGIGTASPKLMLEVADSNAIRLGNAFLSSGGNFTHIATNAWYNGTAWQFAVSAQAGALFQQNGNVTNFYSHAGTSATITNRMTILGNGNVGIGTTAPNASALLDISSTTQGVLFPRMTNAQRQAIATPATGLIIYNTDCNSFDYYKGTTWSKVHDPFPAVKSQTFDGSATGIATHFDQYFVVPCGINSVTVKMWGAGGGGSVGSTGGGGGYAAATVAVTSRETLTVTVGSGGIRGILRSSNVTAFATFGFGSGGAGGEADNTTGIRGASGGGGTGLLRGANLLMAAGGGGGGRNGISINGGAGGGANGATGVSNNCGTCGGGGGGSGFVGGTEVTNTTLTAGSGSTPGNSADG